MQKVAQTTTTTDGHSNLQTELAQRADSVKILIGVGNKFSEPVFQTFSVGCSSVC